MWRESPFSCLNCLYYQVNFPRPPPWVARENGKFVADLMLAELEEKVLPAPTRKGEKLEVHHSWEGTRGRRSILSPRLCPCEGPWCSADVQTERPWAPALSRASALLTAAASLRAWSPHTLLLGGEKRVRPVLCSESEVPEEETKRLGGSVTERTVASVSTLSMSAIIKTSSISHYWIVLFYFIFSAFVYILWQLVKITCICFRTGRTCNQEIFSDFFFT